MILRVAALVLLVLLLALPHPGRRLDLAGADHSALSAHVQGAGHDPDGTGDASRTGQDRLTCVTVCVGAPMVEGSLVARPVKTALALWVGTGGPLSRALAQPATPSRPPNPAVSA